MSTGTSVPKPRVSRMDVSDSALLATLLTEAPIGFAFFGPDLLLRRMNQALASLNGIDAADHIGRAPAQIWPGYLGLRAESAVRHVLEQDQPLFEVDQQIAVPVAGAAVQPELMAEPPAEAREGTPAGQDHAGRQLRHWAFSWFPSHDGDGDISGVALIAVDMTDRRRSEEAVRRSEERYRSLVQAGAQVVWVTTPTGQIAEDSPEWRWITGQTVEEYQGNGWLDAIHPEDRERVERDWQECVGSGKVFDSRYRVRTKTGSYRHYDVRAVPIERDGKIVEWVGASTDVTGQREAEEMRGLADRTAIRGSVAHGAVAAGDIDAGRGADRGAGGRGDHPGGQVGYRRRALRGGDARSGAAPAEDGEPGRAAHHPGRAER